MAKPPYHKMKDNVGGFVLYLKQAEYKPDKGWCAEPHLVFANDDDCGAHEICAWDAPGLGREETEIKRTHLTPFDEGMEWLIAEGIHVSVHPRMLRQLVQAWYQLNEPDDDETPDHW